MLHCYFVGVLIAVLAYFWPDATHVDSMESSPDGVDGVSGRFGFNANISLHDMADSYLAQYKIAIREGKALGMMVPQLALLSSQVPISSLHY